MGLVYSSGDSSNLLSSLSSNLGTAKSTVNELKSGSQRLTAAVDGRTLSGAAYNAGKGLFSELILPTINRVTASMDGIQNDLVKYEGANKEISKEGYLNEDNLKLQIQLMKASKSALTASADTFKNLATVSPIPGLKDMLNHAQERLNRMANSMQDDIDKLQKKIKKLHDFSSQTNGLFSNSLNEMKIAMQGVLVLSGTTVNSDGSYSLPSGTDKSWFSKNYTLENAGKDFLDNTFDVKEMSKESLGGSLDSVKQKVIKEGKNIGKSWAAKLQPRSTLGTFVKDEFRPRKWLTSKLKSVSNPASKVIGNVAKWGGRSLVALGAYEEFREYNDEHHNVGRAITYSAVATGVGVAVGAAVGAVVGGPALVGIGAAVIAGAAVSVGIKAAYNNFKPFKNLVDGTGDALNNAGNKIKERVGNLGKAVGNPLSSLKGAFGW